MSGPSGAIPPAKLSDMTEDELRRMVRDKEAERDRLQAERERLTAKRDRLRAELRRRGLDADAEG